MSFLKNVWAKWKVSIGFVGGAIVVATAYGTCTIEPDQKAIQEAVLPSEEAKEEAPAPEKKEEQAKEEPVKEEPSEKAEEPKKEE